MARMKAIEAAVCVLEKEGVSVAFGVPCAFIAAYSGLMAAPGTPKAWVMPSFSITRTAAIAAFIFAMRVSD